MKIKAKCIKNLFVDPISVKKGEVVDVEVTTNYYSEDCPWLADRNRECIETYIPHRTYYKMYEVRNRWVSVTLFGDVASAKRNKGLLFSDYFVREDIELTPDNVNSIFDECKCIPDKLGSRAFEGVMNTHVYDTDKISENREQIKSLLMQLPDDFMKSKGGGWSFLNMCVRKDGLQWTGFHAIVEKLMTLGMAAGYVYFLLPKNLWHILPGQMPYIVINDKL